LSVMQRLCVLVVALQLVNALPLSSKSGDKIHIVTIGGSGTQWAGAYPETLEENLGSEFKVSNYAKHASLLSLAPNRHCSENEPGKLYRGSKQYQEALSSKPDIVTMMWGMNDAKQCNWIDNPESRFKSAYGELIDDFLALDPQPKIYLLTTQPLYPPYSYGMKKEIINGPLQGIIREIAQEKLGCDECVIDAFNPLGGASQSHPELYIDDGAHPNKKGHRVTSKVIADKIKGDGVTKQTLAALAEKARSKKNAMPEMKLAVPSDVGSISMKQTLASKEEPQASIPPSDQLHATSTPSSAFEAKVMANTPTKKAPDAPVATEAAQEKTE